MDLKEIAITFVVVVVAVIVANVLAKKLKLSNTFESDEFES